MYKEDLKALESLNLDNIGIISCYSSNPISGSSSQSKNLSEIVNEVIDSEFPEFSENNLLKDLAVLLLNKDKITVQILENKLLYSEVNNFRFRQIDERSM